MDFAPEASAELHNKRRAILQLRFLRKLSETVDVDVNAFGCALVIGCGLKRDESGFGLGYWEEFCFEGVEECLLGEPGVAAIRRAMRDCSVAPTPSSTRGHVRQCKGNPLYYYYFLLFSTFPYFPSSSLPALAVNILSAFLLLLSFRSILVLSALLYCYHVSWAVAPCHVTCLVRFMDMVVATDRGDPYLRSLRISSVPRSVLCCSQYIYAYLRISSVPSCVCESGMGTTPDGPELP